MQRNERMQHMGEEERLLLLDLINEQRAVLLSRATDARIIPAKARGWEVVTNSLAASGLGPQRTVKQVKKIWENMKSRAKKYVSDKKQKLFRTGGGPPSPDIKPDPVLEKILALITDELAPAPNQNDSDSPRGDVNVAYVNRMGEQVSEPMPVTSQPSNTPTAPISLMPATTQPSPSHTTPISLLLAGTDQPSNTSSVPSSIMPTGGNNCAALLSSSCVEAFGTADSLSSHSSHSTPLPSPSVLTSVPVTSPSELPPIQSYSTRGKVSGKNMKGKKRKMEDSCTRESYEWLSKFQKEEHEIVMQIHTQTLENKKVERDILHEKKQMMSSLYSQVKDTLEDVRAATAAITDFVHKFRAQDT